MWNRKKYILSSFVGMNQGKILDCCGKLSVNKKKYIHPFCTQNSGVIENTTSDTEHEDSISQKKDSIQEGQLENIIEIHSALQLMEIVKQVNLGDQFYYGGNYKLVEDLDMKDQKWVPFGCSELTPFCGSFDGNGHSIKNLFIQGKRNECTGFFGYLKKAVIKDLSVEGKVKGGKYTGALAGISEDSMISSCFASAKVYGSYCAGGFIGKNTGTITHCYFSGSVQYRTIHPIIISASAAAICMAGAVCCNLFISKPGKVENSCYLPAPIEQDTFQVDHEKPIREHDSGGLYGTKKGKSYSEKYDG